MHKLTLILNVYNEADMLPYLDTVLKHVDAAVITEGSPIGASIDGTGDIIKEYQTRYPITLFQGRFVRDDGGYAQAKAKNRMLEHIETDFIMLHHADLIYDEADMIRLREGIDAFPKKAVFYTPMIEFIYTMNKIRLYRFEVEDSLGRPLVGDVPAFARRMDPIYRDFPTIGLHFQQPWTCYDALYMHELKRYHLCFVRAFPHQVEKHVRRIAQRDWGEWGEELIDKGHEAMFDTALKHVEGYKTDTSGHDYFGKYPEVLGGKMFSSNDGREEFYDNMEKYKERFALYCQNIDDTHTTDL